MFANKLFKRRKRANQPINKFDRREVLNPKINRNEVSYILSNDGDLISIDDPELLDIIEEHNIPVN